MRIIFLAICLSFFSGRAEASGYVPTTAARLSVMCGAYADALTGKPYDMMLLKECEAYLSGFLDSMIVTEAVKGGPVFCSASPVMPAELALALRQWVEANPARAHDATAAVALFGAMAEKYSCAGRGRQRR